MAVIHLEPFCTHRNDFQVLLDCQNAGIINVCDHNKNQKTFKPKISLKSWMPMRETGPTEDSWLNIKLREGRNKKERQFCMKRTVMTSFTNYLHYFETSIRSETNAVKLQKFNWISENYSFWLSFEQKIS